MVYYTLLYQSQNDSLGIKNTEVSYYILILYNCMPVIYYVPTDSYDRCEITISGTHRSSEKSFNTQYRDM